MLGLVVNLNKKNQLGFTFGGLHQVLPKHHFLIYDVGVLGQQKAYLKINQYRLKYESASKSIQR